MMLAAISANTLLSSALVTNVSAAVTCHSSTSAQAAAHSNKPEVPAPSFRGDSATSGLRIEAIDTDHWTAAKNVRFKQLARDEALRELSIEELAELESLTRLRRFEKYPRSADEILWQRRQQNLTRGLVKALEAYVEFHEAPRST